MFKKKLQAARTKLKTFGQTIAPIHSLTQKYVKKTLYTEYIHPPFPTPNERPIEYAFVFQNIATYYPKTILDVGTGLTSLPHLMANCGLRVTAIDNIKDYWSKDMFNRHYHIIDTDIRKPNLTSQFDMITCVSTLEHIENSDVAVRSMSNLLSEHGHLILTFPYNERNGVHNVYTLPGSTVKKLPAYKTSAYSRVDLDRWQRENDLTIVRQEYWQFFSGEYWTIGEFFFPPKQVSAEEKHQITCIVFEKKK